MPTVLVIAGLLVTAAGVVMVFLARFERPAPSGEEGVAGDVKDVLEQFNALLNLIEQRYRIAVVLMAVGLALVGLGAWLEARDAKDEAQETAPTLIRTA